MDIERFHNELAMLLGYERIVNDKRIQISMEESDEPRITINVLGHKDICFKVSGKTEEVNLNIIPEMRNEISFIFDAVHQAFINSNKLF